MRSLASLLFLFCSLCSHGSTMFVLSFSAVIDSSPVIFKEYNLLDKNDSIRITTLRFYISSLQFYQNGSIVFNEPDSYHLIDLAESKSTIFLNLPENSFDEIKFNLGIDSITNNSGVMGGDLDPVNKMYWTWQSGYINFKLEGTSPLCPGNQQFEYHLGGYSYPFNSLREIILPIKNSLAITIELDLNKFFNEANIAEQSHIMSPGKSAMEYSSILSKCFRIKSE